MTHSIINYTMKAQLYIIQMVPIVFPTAFFKTGQRASNWATQNEIIFSLQPVVLWGERIVARVKLRATILSIPQN